MNREEIIQACNLLLNTKLARLQEEINELQAANADNTKSTAGDKHETARAMVHLELEKLGNQFELVKMQLADLKQVEQVDLGSSIQFGSIVETNRGMFFLGVACGKFSVNQETVFGLGMQSPLAKELLQKEKGATALVNGNSFSVLNLC